MPQPAETLSMRSAWWVVGLLALALFINYIDRGAVPTTGHLIQDELGLSPAQLGLLFAAFSFTYAPLQLPMGALAERFGAHKILALGLTVWACATVLVGFAHSFATLLLLRLLLGIGESAGFPCLSKLLAAVLPIKSLGRANGIAACGYLFGPAAGTALAGFIMNQLGYSWRAVFWTFGGLSLLWLLPWSRVRLPARVTVTAANEGPTLGTLLRKRELWGTALGLFSSNYTFFFMLNWLPSYVVRERGFSTAEMTSLISIAFVVNALSALVAGWAIDRAVTRSDRADFAYKSVMVVAHLGSVACMFGIAQSSQPWALAWIFVYQVLNGAASPGVFAMSHILAGPTAAGRWVGVQNMCGNFAGAIAPWVTGWLVGVTQHFTSAFTVSALVSVLGVVGWVWMIPRLEPVRWRLPPAGAAPEQAGRQPA